MTTYQYHDVDIETELELGLPPRSGLEPARLGLNILSGDPADFKLGEPGWISRARNADGEPHFRLYRVRNNPLLAVTGTGLFYLEPERITVAAEPGSSPIPFLLGRVFATWLEIRGVPVLHAATVTYDERAIALLGQSGAGKSTLAAALGRRGCTLLADDLLPCFPVAGQPVVAPGFPISRLWDDSAAQFVAEPNALPRVHSQVDKRRWDQNTGLQTDSHTRTLSRLILLARSGDPAVEIERLPPAQALIELQAMGHDPKLTEALSLQIPRLAKLAGLVAKVPVYQLQYPSDFGALDEVCRAIIDAPE